MHEVTVVRAWSADEFHRQVAELERQGWQARRESYTITPEMNPETGAVTHLYTIEMQRDTNA